MVNLLPKDGEVHFYPDFLNKEESDQLFQHLQDTIEWKQEPISIFGKQVLQPRLTAWYGDSSKPYSYSGITMHPRPFTQALLNVKERLESISKHVFTSVLLNFYRNQQDSMGWHRDNEKELGPNPVIASISLGQEREFQLRHYYEKQLKKNLLLTHGSLLLMQGTTQHYWEHALPKRSRQLDPRINLTFRKIIH